MSETPYRKKHLRTRKLIDKSLQLKLVGAFIAVGCVATLFQVILLNNSMLGLSKELAVNGDVLLAETPGILTRCMLVTLGLLIPSLTLVGVLVTHRIAGPAYRMRCYFQEIELSGKVTYPCRIRKDDELQSMCALVNKAIERIQSDYPVAEVRTTSVTTNAHLDAAPSILPASEPTQIPTEENQTL